MPELYPFLLDNYKKEGKTEDMLKEDIKAAREKYKELAALVKKPSRNENNSGSSPERNLTYQPPEMST